MKSNKFLALFLSVLMAFTMLPLASLSAFAEAPADYLTFTAEEDASSVKLEYCSWEEDVPEGVDFQYSKNGADFEDYTLGTEVSLDEGDYVQLKAKTENTVLSTSGENSFQFSMTGKIAGSGSVTSLLDGEGNNADIEIPIAAFYYLFNYCTALTTAPELISVNLSSDCYNSMFYGCENLIDAPELPATDISACDYCYSYMFYGCSSLVEPPVISATRFGEGSCTEMFSGCTALASAPALALDEYAFLSFCGMFEGCSLLKVEKVEDASAATWVVSECDATTPFVDMTLDCAVSLDIEAPDEGEKNYYKVTSDSEFAITVASAANGNITVSASTAKPGDVIEITANPDKGFVLDTVSVCKTGALSKTTAVADGKFTMPAYAVTVVPAFKVPDFAIYYNKCLHGSVAGTAEPEPGDTVTVTAQADAGFALDKVFYNDGAEHEVVAEEGAYTFTMPNELVDVYATFTPNPITHLTAGMHINAVNFSQASCAFDEIGTTTSAYADVVKTLFPEETNTKGFNEGLLCTPGDNFFATVVYRADGNSDFNYIAYYDTVDTLNADLAAGRDYWVLGSVVFDYSLNIVSSNGTLVSDKEYYTEGETVKLTATPEAGYALYSVTVLDINGDPVDVSENTFVMPEGNVTVTALFLTIDEIELENYKAAVIAKLDAEGVEAIEEYLSETVELINGIKIGTEYENLEAAKKAIDEAFAAAEPGLIEMKKAEFEAYKTQKINELKDSGLSEEEIEERTQEINELKYNESKTLAKNKNAVDRIVNNEGAFEKLKNRVFAFLIFIFTVLVFILGFII